MAGPDVAADVGRAEFGSIELTSRPQLVAAATAAASSRRFGARWVDAGWISNNRFHRTRIWAKMTHDRQVDGVKPGVDRR